MWSTIFSALFVVFVVFVALPVIGLLAWNAISRKGGTGLLLSIGLLVVFLGERWFAEGSGRLGMTGFGLLVALGAVGLRAWVWSTSSGGRREGHQYALVWSSVALGSLLLYGLTLPTVTATLGLSEDAAARWSGVWSALFPIGTLVGLLPTLRLDQILAVHPVVMPNGAARSAQIQGIVGALAICLMFPVNYLAKHYDKEHDVAHFRTTRAGESTLALVKSLDEGVEAILFYPAGNDVASELTPYFKTLASASNGLLTMKVVDQAFDPKLAEELKVRDNGYIVFRKGEASEKFKIDPELSRAKRDLRELDGQVQKNLIKLTRGQRTAYFLVGHGEANWRDKADAETGRFRKISVYKKEVLEAQNFKVKTFGVADGSTTAAPDDADMIVVAAPTTELYPEEIDVLKAYFDKGGSLFVMLNSKSEVPTALLDHIGVTAGEHVLANATAHVSMQGPPADNVLMSTNKYGSHPSVKTLSRNAQALHMVLPDTVSVQKKADTKNKVTTLVRTMPNTWADENGNFLADPEEQKKIYELAVAVTKPVDGADGKEGRAVVVGTQSFLSDVPITRARGNAVFAIDGTRWLIGRRRHHRRDRERGGREGPAHPRGGLAVGS